MDGGYKSKKGGSLKKRSLCFDTKKVRKVLRDVTKK